MTYRTGIHTFRAFKRNQVLNVEWKGDHRFRFAELSDTIGADRIVGVDTESLMCGGKLTTVLVPMQLHDGPRLLELSPDDNPLEKLFDALWHLSENEIRPSRSKQRPRRKRQRGNGTSRDRDGRRVTFTPLVTAWYNFGYDFSRLIGENLGFKRAVRYGGDSYRFPVGAYELEVSRMTFGAAPNFEWFIRRDKKIIRLVGIDLFGYWKKGLDSAAKALGVGAKREHDDDVFSRPREEFTDEQWAEFCKYACEDAALTRGVYLQTAELLMRVDPRVIRRTGLIPFSTPGASARIAFALAQECHPEIDEWERYDAEFDQMGLHAFRAGRSFCHRPGVYRNMASLDVVSMYPYTMSLLPDPVTVRIENVEPCEFDADRFRGKFGVLIVSGDSLDDLNPAFRVHGETKLHYVYGSFTKQVLTIPEVMFGVARGALKVSEVHGGCIMHGTAETSFLRAALVKYFKIKSDHDARIEELEAELETAPERAAEINAKILECRAMRELGKLFANALFGKLVEINCGNYQAPAIPIPCFKDNREALAESYVRLLTEEPSELSDDYYTGPNGPAVRETFKTLLPEGATQVDYVTAYSDALLSNGVAAFDEVVMLSEFVEGYRRNRAGGYFMPLYAAQITGLASAMLATMAATTGALQGDTDSVHIVMPEGMTPAELVETPGVDRYFEIAREAGYPNPRMRDGEILDGVPGMQNAGVWKVEQKTGSDESILLTTKRYSHRFGTEYKQAVHTFAKFWHAELELLPKKDAKRIKSKKAELIHEHMRALLNGNAIQYWTKPAPRKIGIAVRMGTTPGEFVRERRDVTPPEADPNTWTDEQGFIRWKPFPAVRNAKKGEKPRAKTKA